MNGNPLRLQQRVPPFDSDRGDVAVEGIARAMRVATTRARQTGRRQAVCVSPYGRLDDDSPEPVMRVQAWR